MSKNHVNTIKWIKKLLSNSGDFVSKQAFLKARNESKQFENSSKPILKWKLNLID